MNNHQDILVITNGKAVIVPADKWPEEPKILPASLTEQWKAKEEYESQKLEAIAQGAVVDMWESRIAILQLAGLSKEINEVFKDGAYPIDPSLWVVERQWEFQTLKDKWVKWSSVNPPDIEYINRQGFATRQIATIKPKAEDITQRGLTCGAPYPKLAHINPAPAPTRKLAIDELIEYLESEEEEISHHSHKVKMWLCNEVIPKAKSLKDKDADIDQINRIADKVSLLALTNQAKELTEKSTEEKANAFDEGCDEQRRIWIKQMPIAHLVRKEISTMQFVEYIESKLKPANPYRDKAKLCTHENETTRQGDGFVYKVCSDCGEDI